MKILFIISLLCLYSLNYLMKYFFKLSAFFGALKAIKKTFFKEEKKKKVIKKQITPETYEEAREYIRNTELNKFKLNKNNIKEMVKEGFMNPLFAKSNEFYHQITLSLENYLLWKFNGRNLKDINEILNRILNDKTQIELCRMLMSTLEPYEERVSFSNAEIENSDVYKEAASFLQSLGFKVAESRSLLSKIILENPSSNSETVLRIAMKNLN